MILIVLQNFPMVLLRSEQLSFFLLELARVRLDLFLKDIPLVLSILSGTGDLSLIQSLIMLA